MGEKLKDCKPLKPYHLLLINPGYSVSTSEIYKNLNLGLTKCEKNLKEVSFNVEKHLCNDLEAVTAEMHPDIKSIKKLLLGHGAAGALMSGSGPTVFGLFCEADKARNAYHCITEYNRDQMFLADIVM